MMHDRNNTLDILTVLMLESYSATIHVLTSRARYTNIDVTVDGALSY